MSLIDLENRYFNGGHGGPWASSNDTQVRVLIDGEQYFRALNTAINICTGEGDVIYLLNWSLISTFHLIPHGEAGSMEIGQQLAEKAARGVDVRSIIWIHQLFRDWVASRTPARTVGEENLASATALRSLMVGAARPLQYRVLLQESFVLACPTGHKLATRKRVDLHDLEGVRLIRFARTGSIGQHLEYLMRGIAVEEAMEVEHLPTVAGLVAAGLGISVVPSIAVPFFDATKVALVPVVSKDLDRPIHLVWQTSRVLGPAAQAFVDLLESCLPRKKRSARRAD